MPKLPLRYGSCWRVTCLFNVEMIYVLGERKMTLLGKWNKSYYIKSLNFIKVLVTIPNYRIPLFALIQKILHWGRWQHSCFDQIFFYNKNVFGRGFEVELVCLNRTSLNNMELGWIQRMLKSVQCPLPWNQNVDQRRQKWSREFHCTHGSFLEKDFNIPCTQDNILLNEKKTPSTHNLHGISMVIVTICGIYEKTIIWRHLNLYSSNLRLYHYIHWLQTLESLKINENDLISSLISYCDCMYLCQIG